MFSLLQTTKRYSLYCVTPWSVSHYKTTLICLSFFVFAWHLRASVEMWCSSSFMETTVFLLQDSKSYSSGHNASHWHCRDFHLLPVKTSIHFISVFSFSFPSRLLNGRNNHKIWPKPRDRWNCHRFRREEKLKWWEDSEWRSPSKRRAAATVQFYWNTEWKLLFSLK